MEGKREMLEKMLAKGDTMLCIDSRHRQVRVPENHQGKADLRLVLNLGFRHPFEVKPDGVHAELSFGGVCHVCWIPYESLWGVYNPNTGEGCLWPDDLPAEVRHLLEAGKAGVPARRASGTSPGGAPTEEKPRRNRPSLRVIPGRKKD